MIDYDLPENATHYIVLESISSNTSKVIHVVNMSELNKLFIGRGHDAHVRVTDISVSRLHAIFYKAQNGYFYLTDLNIDKGARYLKLRPHLLCQL